MVQMYLLLNSDEALHAVQAVHDAVLKGTKRHRKARQPEMKFYINGLDRKLDRIGDGRDSSCYHVILFS